MRNGLPAATGSRSRYSLLLNPFTFRHQTPRCQFPPTGTTVAIETLPIFMAIADSMPHTTRIDSRFVDDVSLFLSAPRSPFHHPLIPHFLVTVLRSSMLFTRQTPRVPDTQNIHIAHTLAPSYQSRHNDNHIDPQRQCDTEHTPHAWILHECMLISTSHIICVSSFYFPLPAPRDCISRNI